MPVTKKEKSHRATNWASNALAVVHACYHPTIPMRRDLPRSGKADTQSFLERRSTAPPPDHGKPAHDSPNNGRREASYLPSRSPPPADPFAVAAAVVDAAAAAVRSES